MRCYLCAQVTLLAGQIWEHVRHQYHLDLFVVRQLRFLKLKEKHSSCQPHNCGNTFVFYTTNTQGDSDVMMFHNYAS